jgi:hypothetical protein
MPGKGQIKGVPVGAIFGRLTVIKQGPIIVEGKNRAGTSVCKCECGAITTIRNYVLRRKARPARSCGCVKQHGEAQRFNKSREYRAWIDMKTRCRRDPRYKDIHVCDQWLKDFNQFLNDMGRCPPGLTLDRVNNKGNYEPGNCRWTDMKTQNRNRKGNRLITVNGKTMTVSEWMESNGLDVSTFYRRLKLGWTEEEAASTPKYGKR